MNKIKAFIYLDNNKMYSISSQLFSGLTEYIVSSETSKSSEKDEQSGLFGSGRVMADIIENEKSHSEKRFLHHYAYNLFEHQLEKENRVLELRKDNVDFKISEIENFNFVKISGRVGFKDSKVIEDTLKEFNSLGESLAYAGHMSKILELETETKKLLESTKDRNQKNSIKQKLNSSIPNMKDIAKSLGLHIDPKMLEHLAKIVEYGYSGSFEAQIPILSDTDYYLFSSLLDRSVLTENENSIITKYSRETEKEFTIFGIPTQVKSFKEKRSMYQDALYAKNDGEGETSMKEAIMNILSTINNVESGFVGKLDYEYIIDPIAIYREL